MSTLPINDNIYPLGSFITAKENPTQELVVMKYYQRIYYCAVAGEPEGKHLAYYEKEITPKV